MADRNKQVVCRPQEGLSKEVPFEPGRRGRHHLVYVAEGMVAVGRGKPLPAAIAGRTVRESAEWRVLGAGRGGHRQSSKGQAS